MHIELDFPVDPVVKPLLPQKESWVRSPVREIRSHVLHAMANKQTKIHTDTLMGKGE